MPYLKQPPNLALQVLEFIAILAIVYGICLVVFPAIFDMLVDTAVIMVQVHLRHL